MQIKNKFKILYAVFALGAMGLSYGMMQQSKFDELEQGQKIAAINFFDQADQTIEGRYFKRGTNVILHDDFVETNENYAKFFLNNNLIEFQFDPIQDTDGNDTGEYKATLSKECLGDNAQRIIDFQAKEFETKEKARKTKKILKKINPSKQGITMQVLSLGAKTALFGAAAAYVSSNALGLLIAGTWCVGQFGYSKIPEKYKITSLTNFQNSLAGKWDATKEAEKEYDAKPEDEKEKDDDDDTAVIDKFKGLPMDKKNKFIKEKDEKHEEKIKNYFEKKYPKAPKWEDLKNEHKDLVKQNKFEQNKRYKFVNNLLLPGLGLGAVMLVAMGFHKGLTYSNAQWYKNFKRSVDFRIHRVDFTLKNVSLSAFCNWLKGSFTYSQLNSNPDNVFNLKKNVSLNSSFEYAYGK